MDITELEKLVKLMNENDIVELEVEEEGSSIRLRKAQAVAPAPVPVVVAPAAQASAAAAPVAEPKGGPAGLPPGVKEIRSPILGTFYKAPSPESPPFASVGDRVKPDSVVCIIEAMKVMNEIKAEVSGEIIEVLVENGEPVEFDQPLFRVRAPG